MYVLQLQDAVARDATRLNNHVEAVRLIRFYVNFGNLNATVDDTRQVCSILQRGLITIRSGATASADTYNTDVNRNT